MVTLSTRDFHGWSHTQFLSNDDVELILTSDVGPRILGYRLKTGPNVMKHFTEQLGQTGGDAFRAYGVTASGTLPRHCRARTRPTTIP